MASISIMLREYVSPRTGLKVQKYFDGNTIIKNTVLPKTHPLHKYGINNIVMRKQLGVEKEIELMDADCNTIALSSDFKEGILGLKKYMHNLQVFLGRNGWFY